MRALWTGSLSFGLINIPVRLQSGTQDHGISLNLFHKKDKSPIRYARICEKEEKEVDWEDIVKGYRLDNGKVVLLDDEDFQKANASKTSMIDIIAFVEEKEIDSVYFEKPYFLEPKGEAKPYLLMREALKKSKKVGLCRFVLRNRENLGIIRPYKNCIILNQLRFDDEIRSVEDLKIGSGKASKEEVDLAVKLIDQLTKKFQPKSYKDTYVRDLKGIIEKKAKGKKIVAKGKKTKANKIHDLSDALKQSLKKKRKSA